MRSGALLFGIIISLCSVADLNSQVESENIVPNPSFEQYSSTPLGWFYTGRDFTRVMRYWESPSAASPDVYGPSVFVPSDWRRQGFGDDSAHDGKSMVGITVFGCEGGKPHCREYVQAQLNEPLVPGQRYKLSFWTKPLPTSLRIREICVAFTKKRSYSMVDDAIEIKATTVPTDILSNGSSRWVQIEAEIEAGGGEEYLIIGNFYKDADTHARECEGGSSLAFGYYYIDNVVVKKLPPILDVPVAEDDLSNAVLETGATIRLNNIYFDYDRDDFLPRSYKELGTLLNIMRENPSMRIEVRGHTDNTGESSYNLQLSQSRARAVTNYLVDHGIAATRLQAKGFGSNQPVATNKTEEGRQENRRVEFVILSK